MYFEKTCLPSINQMTQRSWSQCVKKSDKTWPVSYGLAHPDRTVPHRTVPNRTYSTALSGSLVVCSWYSWGTVRYFFGPVLYIVWCACVCIPGHIYCSCSTVMALLCIPVAELVSFAFSSNSKNFSFTCLHFFFICLQQINLISTSTFI